VQLLALRGDPGEPPATPPATSPSPSPSPSAWALAPRIALPDYLDEAALLTAEGAASLRRWPATRWAEPLRDALPRLLAADLRRLGVAEPAAAAGPRPRQLQLSIDELLAMPGAGGLQQQLQLRLVARWRWSAPERSGQAVIVLPCEPRPDAIAHAHRLALWALAQRLAADA
jgi:uncharacterized protein